MGWPIGMKRILAIFALCMLATGCVGVAGVEGVSVMATEKTVVDHVISISSGKNKDLERRIPSVLARLDYDQVLEADTGKAWDRH